MRYLQVMEHQRIQGRFFLWTLQRKQAMLAPLYWTLVSRSMREYILAVCVLVRFCQLDPDLDIPGKKEADGL